MQRRAMSRRPRAPRRSLRTPGAPPGPRRADIRRANLLAAAEALFIAHGVEATTIDDIAARADVAKGTFYHYFSSKTALLDALRDRFSEAFLQRVTDAVAACAPDDWRAKLVNWIETGVTAYYDMYALHDVVFHGAEMPARAAMGEIDVVRSLADLLAAGNGAGAWHVENPPNTAVVMFHGLHGATDEAIVTSGHIRGVGPLLAALYLRMIGAGA